MKGGLLHQKWLSPELKTVFSQHSEGKIRVFVFYFPIFFCKENGKSKS